MKQVYSPFSVGPFFSGCTPSEKENPDFYTLDLFRDVQLNAVYRDSKTFVDCTPKRDLNEIIANYEKISGITGSTNSRTRCEEDGCGRTYGFMQRRER